MQDIVGEYLKDILREHFEVQDINIELTPPPKKNMGDFAFGCFLLARELKKSPNMIATELSAIINADENKKDIERVEADGPYLNIFISGDSYLGDFLDFIKEDKDFTKREETIVIDYIGANVGKPLHIGHMCTPTQGQAIINVYEKLGYSVISDSHICDWGTIFGKLIKAFQEFGSEDKLHANAVEHLFELYVKITKQAETDSDLEEEFRDIFKQLSHGSEDLIHLWQSFTSCSIDAMNIPLARLGVFPQYNIGESFYEGIGLPKIENYPDLTYSMKDIVEELVNKKIATQNEDGSVGVEFPEETKIPSCILQKRNGTHGYLASDLACIKYRMGNWNPEKMLYFVDVRQQLHFKQAFYIALQAGWLEREGKSKTELYHAYNGFITLKDGAMSTRKGKIIKLDLLLDEAEERAKKIILEKRDDIDGAELKDLARIIGIGAVKYGYLKKTRESDVVFDWDEFMTFEGNSGPYVQYSYVRARNILSKAGEIGNITEIGSIDISSDLKNLMMILMQYKSVLEETASEAHPHILTKYCYDLAKAFNSVYNSESILEEAIEEYKNIKLMTLSTFSETLKEAFSLLAIDMPEKM